jgi:hypothetical protein
MKEGGERRRGNGGSGIEGAGEGLWAMKITTMADGERIGKKARNKVNCHPFTIIKVNYIV